MTRTTNRHLSQKQLYDLLLAMPQETSPELEALREHLRDCSVCADELTTIRRPLSHFRSATTAWAHHTSASRSWTSPALLSTQPAFRALKHVLTPPALWASAATLLLAAAIPFALHHHSAVAPSSSTATIRTSSHNTQAGPLGDEALLDEVNQTLSSSVPAPMQPLVDPTAGRSNQVDSTPRKN